MENRPEDEALGLLTPREREVLALLRLGLTNQEIAERLGISADGAKYHVSEIISKLGVSDRYEAASWPERRPWWTAALTPAVLLWRNAVALVSINLSWVAAATSAGLLATVLGGTGLMAFLLVRSSNDPGSDAVLTDSSPQPVGAQQGCSPGFLLLSEERCSLSLCVDGAGGETVSDGQVETVRDRLESVLAGVSSLPPEYGKRAVVRGCPPAGGLTAAPVDPGERPMGAVLRDPDVPSEHRVFVYFLSPEAYAASFGGETYGLATEEMFCRLDQCWGVTLGLYVSTSLSSELLGQGLLKALGLLPSSKKLSPVDAELWQRCELGTPEDWCEDYDEFKREQQELEQLALAQLADQSAHNPLLTDDRTHLSICVDGAAGYSVTDADVEAVRETLEDAVASVSNVPPEYSERKVVEGCPPAPPALTDDTWSVSYRLIFLEVQVDVPSEHRVFVYLLPPHVYETSFGSELYTIVGSEFFCGGGDACLTITRGLYVPASVSSDVLREGLVSVLNLVPYTPGPGPSLD